MLARQLARQLHGLTVVTHSALVCLELGRTMDNTIISLGGQFDPSSACFVGPTAEEAARRLFVDVAYLSTKGFLPAEGIFESSMATFRIKQIVAEQAARVVLLVDHSKFGQRALCKVLDIAQIHEVITDAGTVASDVELLQQRGLVVRIAPGDDVAVPAHRHASILEVSYRRGECEMKTIAAGGAPRHVWFVLTLLFAGCCHGAVAAEPVAAAPAPDKDVFLFIPHTHWEGAVFKTREEYLDMGLSNILRALALLKAHPDYRFVLDQVCYVRPFLERYPEEAAAFRQFVQEGRLAIVGGTDVMPDVNMPGGESFVRQVLYGKGYFRQKLGVDVTVGWQLDTFGHHPQMPQLLKLGGYKSFWTQRGMSDPNTPSEFLWEGIDGSQIPTFWLPQSYAMTYGSPAELPAFSEFFQQRFAAIAPYSRGRGRVGLAGADVCEPEVHVPALVEPFNRQAVAPFELRIAVPTDFETLVAERPDRPVVRGDFNPIFQGTYSSRIELKQRTRELERLLTTAEKLGVMLHWLAVPIDDEVVWRAWEPMLFNQAHDLMSGVMTDHVYEDTIRGYDFSHRIATDEVQARLRAASAAIDTQGEGIPVVVWNMLGWPRTDIVDRSGGICPTVASPT